jgi:thymidylate synthase
MKTMQLPHFSSIDEVQVSLLKSLLEDGQVTVARQMKTLEISPMGFVLTNPRARCIINKARKWSFPLAIGELAWHLSGSHDVDFISYYGKEWRNFSENGKVIMESCYGHKIFARNDQGKSQWDNIVHLLQEDPATRRAVLSLYDGGFNLGPHSKDVACICTIQFLIRDGRLDAITHMRSNDVIWGLPYDLFLVTMLQEYLSQILSVDLGIYYHFANSMHLYERHFKLAENILNDNTFLGYYEMLPMSDIGHISHFLDIEKAIRESVNLFDIPTGIGEYWRELLIVLGSYHLRKIPSHSMQFLESSYYSQFIESSIRLLV